MDHDVVLRDFVIGAAISESMAEESIAVWEDSIKIRGTQDTLLIDVSVEG